MHLKIAFVIAAVITPMLGSVLLVHGTLRTDDQKPYSRWFEDTYYKSYHPLADVDLMLNLAFHACLLLYANEANFWHSAGQILCCSTLKKDVDKAVSGGL